MTLFPSVILVHGGPFRRPTRTRYAKITIPREWFPTGTPQPRLEQGSSLRFRRENAAFILRVVWRLAGRRFAGIAV